MRTALALIILSFISSCSKSRRTLLSANSLKSTSIELLLHEIEKQTLDPSSQIISIKDQDLLSLRSINTKDKVFLFISEIHCTNTIEQELKIIGKHYNSHDIYLLCLYNSMRNVQIYLRQNKVNINAYLMKFDSTSLLPSLSNPTYFMLDNQLRLYNAYMPTLGMQNRSMEYLQKALSGL